MRKKQYHGQSGFGLNVVPFCSEYKQREESLHNTMPTTTHLEPFYALEDISCVDEVKKRWRERKNVNEGAWVDEERRRREEMKRMMNWSS